MKDAERRISLARMYYPVKTLGPGNRVGIWLNGCNQHCDGCISPELRLYDEKKEVSIGQLLQMIRSIELPIDGFTISGGEPFYDAEALCTLVLSVRNVCDDILIYTGYTIEELIARRNEATDSVIANCAALVDGPYIKERNDNKGLRGSSNQRCFVFKYHDKYKGFDEADRTLQTIVYGGKVLTIGIPRGEEGAC